MDQNKFHLEYKEMLKIDYTKNYFEIIFNNCNRIFEYIYLYNFEYGSLKYKNGKKETHKWETEDEAKKESYLNKHYPIICLNGLVNDKETENKIIEENIKYIKTLKLSKNESALINMAVKCLRNTI